VDTEIGVFKFIADFFNATDGGVFYLFGHKSNPHLCQIVAQAKKMCNFVVSSVLCRVLASAKANFA
ncbi:MAG: hypothetical protein IIV06_07915, partial [Alistipes sp.]|nr:hypothetical protein [Alistipes sp.]